MDSREAVLKNGQTALMRLAVEEDAAQLLNHLNRVGAETEFLTFGEGGVKIDLEKEKKLINQFYESKTDLMLLGFIEMELIACLTFRCGERARLQHRGEFGITVRKKWWSIGIGRAMVSHLIEWAKMGSDIRKINLKVRSDNRSAISLYTQLGFQEEGLITRDLKIDNTFYDCLIMGMEINTAEQVNG